MVKRVAKIKSKPVKGTKRGIPLGAVLACADNTGARKVRIISVAEYRGRHRRLPIAGIGDMVNCTIEEGDEKLRNQIFQAIVVRQKKEYRRTDGTHIGFEDNAAVLTTADGDLKGTEIKGAVARESANKWPGVSAAASIIL